MKKWKKGVAAGMAVVLTVGMVPAIGSAYVSAADEGTAVPAARATELLQNGGFEQGSLIGWEENGWCKGGGATSTVMASDGDVTPMEGSHLIKHEGKSNGAQITQKVTGLTAGKSYWVTGWMYQDTAKALSFGIHENEGKDSDPQFHSGDEDRVNQWVKKAVRFTMWENAANANVYTWQKANTVGYVDGISLVEAADYSQLESAIADAQNKAGMTDYYTKESISQLTEVLGQAAAMADKNNVDGVDDTQTEVDAMKDDLQAKIDALKVQQGAGEIEGISAYYIDAKDGNDDNAGTSEDQAWKTFKNVPNLRLKEGGKVLLKAGCIWNGEQLKIKDAHGTKEVPVIIGRYGDGADPVINGNGNPWQTNLNAAKQDVATVHIYNSSNIIVQDLEVTNWESDDADLMKDGGNSLWGGASVSGYDGSIKYDQSKYLLTGILVENHDAGDLENVVVKNNHVHDVNGKMLPEEKKGSGGIVALVTGSGTKSSFVNLQITGNEVNKVSHEAIYMESYWAARTLVGHQKAGDGNWYGWKDMYVANNYVHDVAGDGIVLINADGAVAEKNLVVSSASEEWNYSRNPAHAAIWMWDCNNVTMQYNEAAFTESYQDGMAFDFDYGNQNVMYQYNYSHDNKGGFWMSCPGPSYTVNAVARYNLSVNDGLFDGARIIRIGERGSIGNQFHNNTMYWDHDYKVNAIEQATWGTPPSSGTDIYNNIFCGNSEHVVKNAGVTYRNNCVYGGIEKAYLANAQDTGAIVADPKFVKVKDYTTGTFQDGVVTLGDASGFALQSDSPCIDGGVDFMAVPKESLPAVAGELVATQITIENKDYAGNPAPYADAADANYKAAVDIGAFEYQGKSTAEPTDTTYLEALIKLAEKYSSEKYTEDSVAALKTAVDGAKDRMNSSAVMTQVAVDTCTAQIESAIGGLLDKSSISVSDDILASYNSGAGKDNHSFETGSSDWGAWQSAVSIDGSKAKDGQKSLKVVKNGTGTAYSEIGNVPVKKNTDYILEAWLFCSDEEAANVVMAAKHHNNVTGSGDIGLGNAGPDVATDNGGWKKVVLNFTTKGYEKISLSVNSNIAEVWMDNATLQEITNTPVERPDLTEINQAIETPIKTDESSYTKASWSAYADAYGKAILAAKLAKADVESTAEELKAAAEAVAAAETKLVKAATAADIAALKAAVEDALKVTEEDYQIVDSFRNALKSAADLLNEIEAGTKDASHDEVIVATTTLTEAKSALKPAEKPVVDPVDKDELTEAVNGALADSEESKYTKESWEAYKTALANARAVLADEKADQDAVNKAVEALVNAKNALKQEGQKPENPDTKPENPDTKPDSDKKDETKAPQTGDFAPTAEVFALLLLSGAAVLSLRKRED